MRKQIDYLLIGHGLAGATLAFALRKRGLRVAVIDNAEANSATRVAAGIINPVSGHRLNISDGFGDYFPLAVQTYRAMENSFGVTFFQPMKQLRLLKNMGQYEYYLKRQQDDAYSEFLGPYEAHSKVFRSADYGAIEILKSAVVDTLSLLAGSEKVLHATGALQNRPFDHAQLSFTASGVEYKDLSARNIVFCEGHRAQANPWLQDLPFKLAKGEIADIELPSAAGYSKESRILNWGNWLIPGREASSHRLGASYQWDDLSLVPNETANLLASLQKHTGLSAKVISTATAIRPTTKHRQPFVGPITGLDNAYCFNGFGSKGCLSIPYFAEQLCDHMLDAKPLSTTVTQWL